MLRKILILVLLTTVLNGTRSADNFPKTLSTEIERVERSLKDIPLVQNALIKLTSNDFIRCVDWVDVILHSIGLAYDFFSLAATAIDSLDVIINEAYLCKDITNSTIDQIHCFNSYAWDLIYGIWDDYLFLQRFVVDFTSHIASIQRDISECIP